MGFPRHFTASGPSSKSYVTQFPLTENPISEGGAWQGGLTVGLDWNNCQTNGQYCYSAADAFAYNDCTELLTGVWSPTQHVYAQVRTVSQNPGMFQEVALRFRSTLSAHVCTGYELFFHCAHDGSQYVGLARWDGALGSFTLNQKNTGPGLSDQDWIDGALVGNVLTASINGAVVTSWDISTDFNGVPYYVGGTLQGNTTSNGTIYTSGNPGFGMDEGNGGGSTLSTWGLYSWSVIAT